MASYFILFYFTALAYRALRSSSVQFHASYPLNCSLERCSASHLKRFLRLLRSRSCNGSLTLHRTRATHYNVRPQAAAGSIEAHFFITIYAGGVNIEQSDICACDRPMWMQATTCPSSTINLPTAQPSDQLG